MKRHTILVCGPDRGAVSGVSTHLNLLMGSTLAEDFDLVHFQVGSEGRGEERFGGLLRLLASPFALVAAILSRKVDAVHLNTSLNVRAYWRDLAYLVVAKLLRVPVLWHIHGGQLPRLFCHDKAWRLKLLAWTMRLPDLIAVLAKSELDAYNELVPGAPVVLVPNGIDWRAFARVPTVRSTPGQTLRVVFFGRLVRVKGLYETLQALRIVTELGIDMRLSVAGTGPEDAALRNYAHELGVAGRVAFLGPLFGEAKVKMLASADLMVLPSREEGLPYALLEAMAAGVPVIATPVGAIPDVVTDGIHGLIVPPGDSSALAVALAELARDRSRLSWMSRACRKRVHAAYSVERLARDVGLQYRALVGGDNAAAALAWRMPASFTPRVRRAAADASPPGN